MNNIDGIRNTVICGDALRVLKELPDESVDCCVTSPPYWALRDYGVEGQLGLEPTFQGYITKLCNIFDEVKRVLKKSGTCWVNMGDTYSNSGGAGSQYGKHRTETLGMKKYGSHSVADLPDKCLCQIPSRFAIEMTRRRGYIIKTETDEAWLGGIIEGEGCITIAHHNGYYEPRVQIAMVNKDVLDRVQQITGVGKVAKQTDRNNPKWRESYIWKASGSTAAKICSDVFNYLISKQEQARIIWRMVEMQKERERTGGDPYSKVGQKYSEKQMAERQKWFEEIKRHNQGNGTPTKLKNPTKNEPWILRNTIIWYKPNCMPSSVKDRFTVDFEKVFFFVKNKKYWFETQYDDSIWYEKDKRAITGGITKSGKSVSEQGNQYAINKSGSFNKMAGKRNKRCVWKVTTKPFKEAHFATYPEALIEPMIKAGCPEFICKKCGKPREKIIERKRISRKELPKDDPRYRPNEYSGTYGEINGKSDAGYCERKIIGYTDCGCNAGFEGGIVLDPFFGAGTTGVVALKQNKRYVGIELNREYIEMANKRLSSVTNKLI